MALVTDGILTQKLPWGLVLIGVFLTIAIELMGLQSLPIAVGVYLPISTSAAMFAGGVVRWLVERRARGAERSIAEVESGPGVLFSSGLIAGGALAGDRHRRHRRGAGRAGPTRRRCPPPTTWRTWPACRSALGAVRDERSRRRSAVFAGLGAVLYRVASR